ncbi:hypothetical protein BaRGS_00038095 [Batillaria attramentaria]|uniref:AAA+ ATPase domain-containing protein n=1 Tax=Batillaria attramentaria TaxID=370345 RepID=A0ABD0J875_9CAEN
MLFLTGSPGTGKTVMLVLKARVWLQEGEHVYVTCLDRDALAAACLIISQLRQMAPDAAGRIHLLDMRKLYGQATMSRALRDVVLNVGGKLNIIADEVDGSSDRLKSLCGFIMSDTKVTQFRLWAAGVRSKYLPECLQEVPLTDPLRCPPVVVRKVIKVALRL